MEFEIEDEPQGLPDRSEGDRYGGSVERNGGFKYQPVAQPGDPALDNRRYTSFDEQAT